MGFAFCFELQPRILSQLVREILICLPHETVTVNVTVTGTVTGTVTVIARSG